MITHFDGLVFGHDYYWKDTTALVCVCLFQIDKWNAPYPLDSKHDLSLSSRDLNNCIHSNRQK